MLLEEGNKVWVDGRSPGWAGHTGSCHLQIARSVLLHRGSHTPSPVFATPFDMAFNECRTCPMKVEMWFLLNTHKVWDMEFLHSHKRDSRVRASPCFSLFLLSAHKISSVGILLSCHGFFDKGWTLPPWNCLVSSTLYSLKLRFVIAVYCSSRKETNTLDLKKSPGLAQR